MNKLTDYEIQMLTTIGTTDIIIKALSTIEKLEEENKRLKNSQDNLISVLLLLILFIVSFSIYMMAIYC